MQQFSSLSRRSFTAQHVLGIFPTHHQELNDFSGSLWFYLRIMVIVMLCSWSGRLTTAVIELLMMGGKTLETC
jgi:hypothetical protein